MLYNFHHPCFSVTRPLTRNGCRRFDPYVHAESKSLQLLPRYLWVESRGTGVGTDSSRWMMADAKLVTCAGNAWPARSARMPPSQRSELALSSVQGFAQDGKSPTSIILDAHLLFMKTVCREPSTDVRFILPGWLFAFFMLLPANSWGRCYHPQMGVRNIYSTF